MKTVSDLTVKIFADGADKAGMLEMYANPLIKGFTTNPTLMRKAAVNDYRAFAQEIIKAIPDRPISFEVFADEFDDMERQALEISSWGNNVNVKIPVTNTKKQPSYDLLRKLARAGVKLNVTALMTLDQVREASGRPGRGSGFLLFPSLPGASPTPGGILCPNGRGSGNSPPLSKSGAHLGQPPRTCSTSFRPMPSAATLSR